MPDGAPALCRAMISRIDLHAMMTSTPIRVSASRADSGIPVSVTSFEIPCGSRILCRQIRLEFGGVGDDDDFGGGPAHHAVQQRLGFEMRGERPSRCRIRRRPRISLSTCRSCSARSVWVP